MTLYSDFPTDVHRRVCANLAQPRTWRSLVEVLHADQHCPLGHGDQELIRRVLAELVSAGDVVDLGDLRDAHDLVYVPRGHEQAISMHPEKEAILVSRAQAQPERYFGGHQFILSEQGLAKLTGPAPPEQIPEPLPDVEPEPVDVGWLRGVLRRGR